MRFKDKVVIITGSGRGIGKELAIEFAKEGAKVVVCALHQSTCDNVLSIIKENGGEAISVPVDVSKEEGARKLIETATDTYGTIDILVNNAGVVRDKNLPDMTVEDWDMVLDISLKGAFLCSKYAVPIMIGKGHGKIVNMSSRAYLGNPGQANYSAAKAGIIGLTCSMAKELGKFNINVNAVAPGLIETEMIRNHPKYETMKERQIKATPIPRIGQIEDVIKTVMFFVSDESSYITGDVLHVSGGRKG